MNKKERLLASKFLEEMSDRYGDHGCNDWKFPNDWTRGDKLDFILKFHKYNGDLEEFNGKNLDLPDFCAIGLLADLLRKECEDTE